MASPLPRIISTKQQAASGYCDQVRHDVIPLMGLDSFASDIEICKHISASLSSYVIPALSRNLELNFVYYLSRSSISLTAFSMPTNTLRATMLWPMFTSSIPSMAAMDATLR